MKFNIVDPDTERLVGTLSVDEHQLFSAIKDRDNCQAQVGENPEVNRLWRFDSYINESQKAKRSKFGDFKCSMHRGYGIELVPQRILQGTGDTSSHVVYDYIAFNTRTEATSDVLTSEEAGAKWIAEDVRKNKSDTNHLGDALAYSVLGSLFNKRSEV